MTNSIRTPKQGRTEQHRRIAQAVDNEEWQQFRVSMKGIDTESKLQALKEYYEQQPHRLVKISARVYQDHRTATCVVDYECDTCIRIDNYLKALARGGQLFKGSDLPHALLLDWCLRVKRER
jgi:hypothetical protein